MNDASGHDIKVADASLAAIGSTVLCRRACAPLCPARPAGPADRLVASAHPLLVGPGAGGACARRRLAEPLVSRSCFWLARSSCAAPAARSMTLSTAISMRGSHGRGRGRSLQAKSASRPPSSFSCCRRCSALRPAAVQLLHDLARHRLAAARCDLSLHEALHLLAAVLPRPCLQLGRLVGWTADRRDRLASRPSSSIPAALPGRSPMTRSMRIRTAKTTR